MEYGKWKQEIICAVANVRNAAVMRKGKPQSVLLQRLKRYGETDMIIVKSNI